MQENNTKVVSTGPSLGAILTIVFIILKLCNVIDWNWFWVLSPMIFSVGLTIVFIIILIIIYNS